MLEWLKLDGLPPALAWGIVAFYVAFILWAIAALVGRSFRMSGGAIDLDRVAPKPREVPAFAEENVQRKEEYLAAGDAYVNPEDARRAARVAAEAARTATPRAWSTFEKLLGAVVLVLGLAFIALLAYGLFAKPKADSGVGWLISEGGWQTLLATHWIMIILTLIRAAVALLSIRHSHAGA